MGRINFIAVLISWIRLQTFHLHQHTGKGGETVLVDGIKAAKQLKENYPEAYQFLVKTPITAKYYVSYLYVWFNFSALFSFHFILTWEAKFNNQDVTRT